MARACTVVLGVMALALGFPRPAPAALADVTRVIECIFTPDCNTEDLNGDQLVSAADIVTAIQIGEMPTATATMFEETPTPTATTMAASPTPTATELATVTPTSGTGTVEERIAGGAALVANGIGAIPSVINAIVAGIQFGESASASIAGDSTMSNPISAAETGCPAGGSASISCSGLFSVTANITLNACTVTTPGGGTTEFNGTLSLSGTGLCPKSFLPNSATVNVTAVTRNGTGDTLVTTTIDLTATLSNVQPGGSCFVTGGTLNLNGTVMAEDAQGVGVAVEFTNSQVQFDVAQFSNDCVPIIYTLTFNGEAILTQLPSNSSFNASFSNFVLHYDSSMVPATTTLDGDITSTCFGGKTTIQTETALVSGIGSVCPTGGTITETPETGTAARIFYLATGGVDIDIGLDGSIDSSSPQCISLEAINCPAP